MTIKKIVFALGVLALGFTATAPAHADYAIVSFHSGYCRIWTYTDVVPPDGAFVWFVWGSSPLQPAADLGNRRA
jgi:hypothetical protein